MKAFFKKTGACLRKNWVWTLLLVLSVALLIWSVGPLLAVNDYKLWEGATSRLMTISALFLFWGLIMVFVSWRATVVRQALSDSQEGQTRVAQALRVDVEQDTVRKRFKAALKTLKTSSLYRGRSERWRDDLPWYLVIGLQGSGKTSLLEYSGLDFPINTLDHPPTGDTTRPDQCNWYFAEQGVLIDTPGRYMLSKGNEVDGAGWRTLLALLRKRRRNRPLNGVLLTVPAQDLLSLKDDSLPDWIAHLRASLLDIYQTLHVDVPVYLVLSKADRLSGFDAFFDSLKREESDQVLGATFTNAQIGSEPAVLHAEFEALLHRINDQVLMRMQLEPDAERRGMMLGFPHQLGWIGEGLGHLVAGVFRGNRYQRVHQLRGFYLTSAPHEAAPSGDAEQRAERGTSGSDLPELGSTRSRFIHDLLSRVIFPEADLAHLDTRERRRIHWGQRSLILGAVALLLLSSGLWATGFMANHKRLQQLQNLAQTWTGQQAALTSRDDAKAALHTLDTVYAATQVFPEHKDAGYLERGGLYQGDKVNAVVEANYQRTLERELLPRVARQLESQVRAGTQDRERLLNSLRAYLMLNMQERRDVPWLKDWMATEWSQRYPGDTEVQNGLVSHFDRLLKQPFSVRLDDALVAQARQVLRGESLAAVVYRMLRDQSRNLPEYRLNQHLGPQGNVFVGTDYTIPGLYTQQGYQQYFSLKGSALVTRILKDNWVLGEGPGLSSMDLYHLMVELEQVYFRDYANHWGEAVGQVELSAISDFGEGADQLAGLTSANSPILQLLMEVRENTRFALAADAAEEAADAAGALADKGGKLGALAVSAAGSAAEALTKKLPDTAKKSVQSRFEPLHRLLDDNNVPTADLAAMLASLNELQLQVASLARASFPEQAAFEMAKNRMEGRRDALSNVRSASTRLPRPVGAWLNVLAEDTWRLTLSDAYQFVNQHYQNELYSFYGKALNQRYPFNAHSTSDVAISDFREFFKPQGIAERFFDTYMRPFVSGNAGQYRVRSIDGVSLPISKTYLEQMGAAAVIRQSFFADNPAEPQVLFKMEPYTLDSAVSRSEFKLGDKAMEYRHGPIVPMSFKWPVDAEDGRASLVLDRMVGRPIGIEENTGPWSLFRLFDLMQTEHLIGRDVLVLKANVGGLRANYLLTSQRMPNPFDMSALRGFRMPVQL